MSLKKYIQLSGPLFEAVQEEGLFEDGKTFVDAVPHREPQAILQAFEQERKREGFDLKCFVDAHFSLPQEEATPSLQASDMKSYIESLWPLLRKEMEASSPYSSLISLPHPHTVPGGRFRECFYWDSYFAALGLLSSGHVEPIEEMVLNFAYLIEQFGFIPNGNRVYFASRSHPPFFSFLLTLLYEAGKEAFALSFFSHLKKEYDYWMTEAIPLEGTLLNRYFDALNVPRPEAYAREQKLQKESRDPEFCRHLRAACASGWDFSSRWLEKPEGFQTIRTLDILPIDLNAFLYHMEETLARFAEALSEDPFPFSQAAATRKKSIQTLFWKEDFFFDYHLPTSSLTPTFSLAAATPLFTKIATPAQADAVAKKLEKEFLLKGGFVTSLTEGGHQWDMPNGWAPLQWMTIQGLLNYGHETLALEGARRWLALNETFFKETRTLFEKYNVRDGSLAVSSGEYRLQQGFGWTNGVALKLMELFSRESQRSLEKH